MNMSCRLNHDFKTCEWQWWLEVPTVHVCEVPSTHGHNASIQKFTALLRMSSNVHVRLYGVGINWSSLQKDDGNSSIKTSLASQHQPPQMRIQKTKDKAKMGMTHSYGFVPAPGLSCIAQQFSTSYGVFSGFSFEFSRRCMYVQDSLLYSVLGSTEWYRVHGKLGSSSISLLFSISRLTRG